MRAALVAVALVGCAQAGSSKNTGGIDAAVPGPDGKVFLDAPAVLVDGEVDSAPHPVDAPPDAPSIQMDACVPMMTELLASPSFDATPQGLGWIQLPVPNAVGGPYYPITNFGPASHSAPFHALLGGLAGEDCSPVASTITDQVYQDVVIPAGTTQLVMTGQYIIGTMEPNLDGMVYDRGELGLVETSGAPIEVAIGGTNLTSVAAWTPFSKTFANPAALAGRTIRVRATHTGDVSYNTNFFFDTLSLRATHCP